MLLKEDPSINDSIKPDFKICWINQVSFKKGNCTIFTYGRGKEIAIATFNTLYPGCEIDGIEELEKVG